MTLTQTAFNEFRKLIGSPRKPQHYLIKNEDELRLLKENEGLLSWDDGKHAARSDTPPPEVPENFKDMLALWAVRDEDVAYAYENCSIAKTLASRVIKHTNLTGGLPAYCAGELIRLDDYLVIINGRSGRYGPQNQREMEAVAMAFKNSGYGVASMGWDEEANRPNPFDGLSPIWV